ncbi:MAG: tetratricopeptide repeat protein [Thermoanaerobaculia bacterium]|nr:tetratricopeptide repeat protein [Thermoanaerobaculia bacterium]
MRHAGGVVALALVAAVAGAQVPESGLAAEGRGAWEEALRIYLDATESSAAPAELWVRIGDIEARLGHAEAAADALAQATAAAPDDVSVVIRFSRAAAVAGQPERALAAAERALELRPDDVELLVARARLANWVADYERARASWQRALELAPDSDAAELGLARTEAWSGELDRAARRLRSYLERRPDDADARLELARVESWRGDFATALGQLEEYRRLRGEGPVYRRERAHSLLGSDRPAAALETLGPPPWEGTDPFWSQLTRTLALAQRQPRRALEGLAELAAERPEDPLTAEAFRVVRTPLRAALVPGFELYDDSDGIRRGVARVGAGVPLGAATRLELGLYSGEIEADPGSGLAPLTGPPSRDYEGVWAALSPRLGPAVQVDLRVGDVEAEGRDDLVTWGAAARLRPSDRFRLALEAEHDYYVVSPRALSLGIERRAYRARLAWQSTLRSQWELLAQQDDLSDGNRRRELLLEPRRSMRRTQRWNLDLGLRGRWVGFDRDLDNGYYDPKRYLQLAATGFAYRKLSSDNGLSFMLTLGGYEDSQSDGFRFGGDAAVSLTLGLYRDWMLELRAAASENSRLASGAFSALSGAVYLTRRFGGPGPAPPEPAPRPPVRPLGSPVVSSLKAHLEAAHPAPERAPEPEPEPEGVEPRDPAAPPGAGAEEPGYACLVEVSSSRRVR